MKRILITFAMALSVAPAAMADLALATAKQCVACHTVDKKLVGPAYKDVAAKYAGQKDAVDKLAIKITQGSSGVWGRAVAAPTGPHRRPWCCQTPGPAPPGAPPGCPCAPAMPRGFADAVPPESCAVR